MGFYVGVTIEQHGVGGGAVSSGASDFLIVAFNIFRQTVMNNPADIRFIDAQTKGDRGADDLNFVADKCVLDFAALVIIHAGVVIRRPVTASLEPLRHVFRCLAGETINNTRLVFSFGEKAQNLFETFLP